MQTCRLHGPGYLPRYGVSIFLSWCDHYDTPTDLYSEAWAETGDSEAESVYHRHIGIGPFDDAADIRRMVDVELQAAHQALALWRAGS